MKKLMFSCLLSFIVFAGLTAQTTPITVYTLKGPSGVGMVKLFEAPPQATGYTIMIEALAQADLMAAKFLSGEAQVGILPANMAAKLASSGKDISVAAVIGQGMLKLISADPTVRSITDLKGTSIEVAGQGATPDYVFRRILHNYKLDPEKDVQLGYALAYPEIAQSLIAGKIKLALLPEPFATMALAGNKDLKVVGDIQAEWVKAGGRENYPMTVLVVSRDLAQKHTAALKAIYEAVENSIVWVTGHPAEAGALVEKYNLGIKAPVATVAIPKSSYVFIPAPQARPSLEALFSAFLEYAPQSIGGKLPSDNFYLDVKPIHE
ncbi:ABC transporter substrate-binding protein [Gracilinema caldarium]|uniref:NMT1/THI5 like domain protein n=1 Tax=Gracilinema caldarium (strain ATCC 51460 / DSM 7334 / H1) TaxID=744872 RepID=F8F2Q7_GRAC1|nr:MqnA/MqnD/SBP family protein [Gracilinema caldarium]AEJ19451.1 NMT1/THI5 like domain protein [Gracilinema caldarium DSM 7334]